MGSFDPQFIAGLLAALSDGTGGPLEPDPNDTRAVGQRAQASTVAPPLMPPTALRRPAFPAQSQGDGTGGAPLPPSPAARYIPPMGQIVRPENMVLPAGMPVPEHTSIVTTDGHGQIPMAINIPGSWTFWNWDMKPKKAQKVGSETAKRLPLDAARSIGETGTEIVNDVADTGKDIWDGLRGLFD